MPCPAWAELLRGQFRGEAHLASPLLKFLVLPGGKPKYKRPDADDPNQELSNAFAQLLAPFRIGQPVTRAVQRGKQWRVSACQFGVLRFRPENPDTGLRGV